MKPGFIKICGVTTVADAEYIASLGADAIGLNLWPQSPRALSLARAMEIASLVHDRIAVVAVMVHATPLAIEEAMRELAPDHVQLHGTVDAACWDAARGRAYRAIGLATDADVQTALSAPGDVVLVDARDGERWGGTGRRAPEMFAERVCRARPTLLAGGLNADNIAEAIMALRPFGVDAASGLELEPGRKDHARVEQFVRRGRAAFGAAHV